MEEKTIEEFYDLFWGEYVSRLVAPDTLLRDNQEFIDEITYDMYRLYSISKIDINILKRITESFIKNMRIYKPVC